jgi:hypothetical protein
MIPMPKPSSPALSTNVRQRAKINRKTKRGIAAAFTPGILKNNSRDESARKILLKHYHEVIQGCGFTEGRVVDRGLPPDWRLSVNPSSSFEVQMNLDKELNLTKVSERSLNWVHGTILDGGKQEFAGNLRLNPDIRLLISTEEKVKEGSDLYQSAFRNGIPIRIDNGKPVLPEVGNSIKRKRNFVSMARNVQKTEIFTNGISDACIVYGDIYFGDKLTITRPFCELSLYFDTKPLRDCINKGLNDDLLENYVKTVFNTAIDIKEKLDHRLKTNVIQGGANSYP